MYPMMSNFIEKLEALSVEKQLYLTKALPSHLAGAKQLKRLRNILGCFNFMQAKLGFFDPNALITDYELLSDDSELHLVKEALQLSEHILASDKTQLAGQLLGRLMAVKSPEIQSILQQVRQLEGATWLRPLHTTLTTPGGCLVKTIKVSRPGHSLAFHRNANLMISGFNGGLGLWELPSGVLLHEIKRDTTYVEALALNSDGKIAVSTDSDNRLHVWNLENAMLVRTMTPKISNLRTIALTSDSKIAVVGGYKGMIEVWDINEGRSLQMFKGHRAQVKAVAVGCNDTI
jgi:WD40 repeat protein